MAVETLSYQNGVVSKGDLGANSAAAAKKSRESERRRRRRKQKKNKASKEPGPNASEDGDDAKENTDPQQVLILLPVIWQCFGLVRFAIKSGTLAGENRNQGN